MLRASLPRYDINKQRYEELSFLLCVFFCQKKMAGHMLRGDPDRRETEKRETYIFSRKKVERKIGKLFFFV